MMKNPKEITRIQTAAILVSTIIGVGVLHLPLVAVEAGQTSAPVVTFLASCLALAAVWISTKLGMRFPRKTFVQYSEVIVGKWLSWFGSGLIIAFFAVLTALTSREFGAVVVTSVLRATPLEVTVLVMLLLAVISARLDSRSFAYIHLFYLPFMMIPVIFIVLLSLQHAYPLFLFPIFDTSAPHMLGGIFTIAALFQGSFVITTVIPEMRHPHKAMLPALMGVGIAGLLYVFVVIAVLAVFGHGETEKLLWPTLELAKATAIPTNFLERLDAMFIAVWVTAVFTTLLSSYYVTVHEMSKLFRLQDHRMLTLFLLPFVFTIAMLPSNVLNLYDIIVKVGLFGLLLTIVYPGLLLIVSIVRGLKEDSL